MGTRFSTTQTLSSHLQHNQRIRIRKLFTLLVHIDSLLWSIQTSFLAHTGLLCLVGMKSFYAQLLAGKCYSSEIVSADCNLTKSHQLQLPFLSSSEPSFRDEVVPCFEMLIAKWVFIAQLLCEMSTSIH